MDKLYCEDAAMTACDERDREDAREKAEGETDEMGANNWLMLALVGRG